MLTNLKEIATLVLQDAASGSEAVVVVRAAAGNLALSLSLANDSDVEVVFGSRDSEALLAALQRAAAVVGCRTE